MIHTNVTEMLVRNAQCWVAPDLCQNRFEQDSRWFMCSLKSKKQYLPNSCLTQREEGKGEEEGSLYRQDGERDGAVRN